MESAWMLPIMYSALPQWPNHIMRREIWFSSLLHDIWLPCIRTPCPIKLAQCLSTIHSLLAKAEFPSQEALCASLLLARQNERTLPQPTNTHVRAQHVWIELCQVRTSERQRSVSIPLWRCPRRFAWLPAFLWKKVGKARKDSDSVTLKIQYWSSKLECGNLQLSHHTH